MLELILFDWHGVLDETRFSDVARKISTYSGDSIEEVKRFLEPHANLWASAGMTGDSFWNIVADQYRLNCRERADVESTIMQVRRNQDLWDLLPELSEQYSLGVLSDCPNEKAGLISSNMPEELSIFRGVYFSYQYGLIKNDDQFFQLPLMEFQIPPRNVLVVDDQRRNVEHALRLGLNGHIYTTPSELVACLAGIAVEAQEQGILG